MRMRTRTTFAKSLMVAAVLATIVSLSGCMANPVDQLADRISSGIAEGGTGKLIESMTGSDVDIQADGTMPKDFPAEVPVTDGKIQSAMGMTIEGTQTWTASFLVDDAESAINLARAELVAAGFAETVWNDASIIMGMFSNDAYQVIVSAFADEDEQVVSYQVMTTG